MQHIGPRFVLTVSFFFLKKKKKKRLTPLHVSQYQIATFNEK